MEQPRRAGIDPTRSLLSIDVNCPGDSHGARISQFGCRMSPGDNIASR